MTTLDAVQAQAEERYWQRAQMRAAVEAGVAVRGIVDTDEPDRLAHRSQFIDPSDGLAWERILGRSDLLGINYLDVGLRVAKAVCRIQVRDERGRVRGFGTGFMVSPALLLTNNHVIDGLPHARRSLADFNFEDDANFIPKPTHTFALDPDRFFYTCKELDFTLVAVHPTATDGAPLADFGYLRLMESTGKILLKEYVSIIQHPSGATKQITLRENQVVDLFDSFIHYQTDTQPGSSGSPVFNDQWQLVALHHAGVKARDKKGRVLAIDDQPWTPAMGEDQIKWIANEGIRVSSICAHLGEQRETFRLDPRALLDPLLGEQATAPPTLIALAPVLEAEEQSLEWYAGSQGYVPTFLGRPVPLPNLAPRDKADRVPLKTSDGFELKYTNFSIVMSKRRRLAFFTAVNIDGARLKNSRREGDRWYFDPRVDRRYQSGPTLYERNDLDRGHLVRRLDPVWGSRSVEANEDTFHFTNSAPQHKALNQKTWQELEDYILKNADQFNLKVVVFTGPVFRDDDLLYRGQFQIPAEFWKVVVMAKPGGKLSATAYLQTQKNLIDDLEFAFGPYKTYQVPVTRIEAITGLDFGALRDNDPLSNIEATVGLVINGPDDLRL